ncbi:MAG: outer membrane beta-barrel protein [Bacteroidota bacterium]|nr:outer membrane beta-barrel protein [Bacteroidota bacterium]
MKIKVLYFFILSTISFNIYSQEFRYGIKIGSVFSKQSLITESKSNIIGVSYNRIGGLPYDVNTYTGYNFGANLELSFKLFPDDYDKRIKSYLGLRSGINYSAQGVIVEDSNRTSFTNKLDYLQIPILINFRMNNFNFFIGPQIGNILNIKTEVRASTSNYNLDTASSSNSFRFTENDFGDKETSFVWGFGYKVYKGTSLEIKSTRGITNISQVEGEIWKNKSYDITINFNMNEIL